MRFAVNPVNNNAGNIQGWLKMLKPHYRRGDRGGNGFAINQ